MGITTWILMILKLLFCVTGNPTQIQHASSAIIKKSLNTCHYLDLLKMIWMWIPLFSRNILKQQITF